MLELSFVLYLKINLIIIQDINIIDGLDYFVRIFWWLVLSYHFICYQRRIYNIIRCLGILYIA